MLSYLGHLVMVHSFEHWLSAILFISSFYMLNVTYIKPEHASFLGNNYRTIKFWHQTALITLANSNAIFIHKIVQQYVVRRLTYFICIHLYVGLYLHQYLIDYDIMFYTKKVSNMLGLLQNFITMHNTQITNIQCITVCKSPS